MPARSANPADRDHRRPADAGTTQRRPARRPPPWHRSTWFDVLQFSLLAVALTWGVVHGAQSMHYPWKWDKVPRYLLRVIDGELIWGPLIKSLGVTLRIAALAGVLGLVIGLATALLRLSRSALGLALAWCYIELIRNTPILVQMLIMYFIVAAVLGIPRDWAGILCLALYEGAFAAEIIRGAILAVQKGQWEAGQSLGFSDRDLYQDIVLPQALPLMLPPLGGVLVNLVKHSAVVSVIAVFDLTTQAPRVRMVVAPIDLVSEGSVSQVVVGGCGVVVEGRCGGQRAALSTASRPVRASASSTNPQPGAAAIPPRF